MSLITIILSLLVALEHFYIMYLETVATQSPATARVFGLSQEELERESTAQAAGLHVPITCKNRIFETYIILMSD